jgi:hypothetical protein
MNRCWFELFGMEPTEKIILLIPPAAQDPHPRPRDLAQSSSPAAPPAPPTRAASVHHLHCVVASSNWCCLLPHPLRSRASPASLPRPLWRCFPPPVLSSPRIRDVPPSTPQPPPDPACRLPSASLAPTHAPRTLRPDQGSDFISMKGGGFDFFFQAENSWSLQKGGLKSRKKKQIKKIS